MEIKQTSLPLRGKRIRYVSFWVSGTEYSRLCEALTEEATVSSFIRGAIKNALKERAQKRKETHAK